MDMLMDMYKTNTREAPSVRFFTFQAIDGYVETFHWSFGNTFVKTGAYHGRNLLVWAKIFSSPLSTRLPLFKSNFYLVNELVTINKRV